jgi:hypothetical protein
MTKLLAADVGFGSMGMAIFAWTPESGWQLFDTKCIHTSKGHDSTVTQDDICRAEFLATGLTNYFIENNCAAIVGELPNGGAQSASAAKCMGAAVTLAAVVRLFLRCPAVWVTPDQSRTAAGWDKKAQPPLPEGLTPREQKELKTLIRENLPENKPIINAMKDKDQTRRQARAAKQKALKEFVMTAMEKKYPAIMDMKKGDKEHVADACSAFEAGRNKQMVKDLEV